MQSRVHMLHAIGKTGPTLHVLEVGRAAVSREHLRIILAGPSRKLIGASLELYAAEKMPGGLIGNTEQSSVIRDHVERGIIFRVVADVEVDRYVVGVSRYAK